MSPHLRKEVRASQLDGFDTGAENMPPPHQNCVITIKKSVRILIKPWYSISFVEQFVKIIQAG